jgi:glycosyltransferase involved in cell wall biosynthesis
MGKITPIGDSDALARAILKVLENPSAFHVEAKEFRTQFEPRQTAVAYMQLYEELLAER